MTTRPERGKTFDMDTRMTLIEGDMDEVVKEIDGVQEQLKRLVWTMVGAIISASTAALMLALNLVAGPTP